MGRAARNPGDDGVAGRSAERARDVAGDHSASAPGSDHDPAARRTAEDRTVAEGVAREFGLGPVTGIERERHGLMHVTWHVRTAAGGYSLQALHPSLAGKGALEDHVAVSAHLAARDFPAPRLVPAPDGSTALRYGGEVWRTTTWLAGRPGARLAAPSEACRAARLLGDFHRATADFDPPLRGGVRLHDPAAHAARLRETLRRAADDPALARWHAAVSEPSARALAALERLALPAGLPERVIHGDPKFSNFVFDADGRAVGLVDLDGCTRASVLYDLGDAVRSWSDAGAQAGPARLREDVVEALLEGWVAAGVGLSAAEREELPRAGALVAWELAARFLRDVLEDVYFAWDPTRWSGRREQNLVRAAAAGDFAAQLETAVPRLRERLAHIR
ncbi:MAG: phosphotransferase [Deltaproteobacteria bacterium]|nr:phosphotransferase [Deltaproteobacteria bacterium]